MNQAEPHEYAEVSIARKERDAFEMKRNSSYGKVSKPASSSKGVVIVEAGNNQRGAPCAAVVVMCILVLVLYFAAAFGSVMIALEISKLKSEGLSVQGSLQDASSRIDALNSSIGVVLQDLIPDLDDRSQLLNIAFRNETRRLSDLLDESRSQLNQTVAALAGLHMSLPASSCAALPPSSPSGYYWVRAASNGSAVRVYCEMAASSCNVTGGWTRVANLDMTNSSHRCPSGLTERSSETTSPRTCINPSSSPGCSSDTIDTIHAFSRICGRVIGYQIGATNAFADRRHDINVSYVDGVSLTHGTPRQHIWTFASALDETTERSRESKCPCILDSQNNYNNRPPPFVGNDYFCDTGSEVDASSMYDTFFGDNPLWDGAGCGLRNTCCDFNCPPWFYRQLPRPTADRVEMRVCQNHGASNENIAVEIVEIFVQ